MIKFGSEYTKDQEGYFIEMCLEIIIEENLYSVQYSDH